MAKFAFSNLMYHNCQTSNNLLQQKSTNPLRQIWVTTSQITSS